MTYDPEGVYCHECGQQTINSMPYYKKRVQGIDEAPVNEGIHPGAVVSNVVAIHYCQDPDCGAKYLVDSSDDFVTMATADDFRDALS